MAGFGNIGTGLGGFLQGFNAQQQADQQRRLDEQRQQLFAQQLQEANRQRQARQILGALALSNPQLFGGGGGGMPSLPMGNAPPMPGQSSQPSINQPRVSLAPQGDIGGGDKTGYGSSDDGGFATPEERRNYILSGARARGEDVGGVDALVRSEGGYQTFDRTGDQGKSFGPFQDYTGGGLGNKFQKETGLDPSNPRNERALTDWNLDYIKTHGASPEVWHGLRNTAYAGGFGAGQGGGQSRGLVGMRASAPNGGLLNPPISRPPPSGYGLNDLATQLRQTNPNIDPETMFEVLGQYQHLMDKPSQDAWNRFKFEVEEGDKGLDRAQRERQFGIEEKRLQQQDFRSDRDFDLRQREFKYRQEHGDEVVAGQGWKVYNDPTNENKPYRFNERTGEARDFEGNPYKPGGISKVGTPNQQPFSSTTQSSIVDMIGTYRAPPPSMSGWSGARAQQIMAEVAKKYPDYDATQYASKSRAAAAVGLRSGQLATQAAVAEEEIPLTLATSEKIDRTQYPTINSMLLAVEKGTGDENVVQFLDQLNALKIVYASALNRSGVNTVDSMRRFDDILNAAWSKGQVRAALDQFRKTLSAERRGIDRAMGGVMGSGTKGGEAPPAETGSTSAPGVIKLDENGNPIP